MARRMQCGWTGKQVYFSQSEADRERNRYNKHKVGDPYGTYQCTKCKHWHHYTKKKKREKPDESVPH